MIKEWAGIIAIALALIEYVPYLIDTLRRKTKPHVYSWFVWSLVTALAFGLQVSHGGGLGSIVTVAAVVPQFIIFFLAIKHGTKNITTKDTIFLILSLTAIVLWLLARQPILSVILVALIDMLGFVPTIRKSWHKPHQETVSTFGLNSLRHALGILALSNYNFVTLLYPLSVGAVNGSFSVFLIVRRLQLPKYR